MSKKSSKKKARKKKLAPNKSAPNRAAPRKSAKEIKDKKPKKISPSLIAIGIGALLVISGLLFLGLENGFLKQLFNRDDIETEALPPNTPRLSVNRDKIDFGVLKYETRKTFNFTVKNTGNTELKFQKFPYIEVVEGC